MMEQPMLVSIIVPVYKVEAYFARCVASILNQSYTNLEIILVDDGSPDNCPKMCDDYAQQDQRIKVIHQQNKGLMAAWTAGVKHSTGEYVYFIDSDDWIEPFCISDYVEIINKHHPDMVINDFYIVKRQIKKVRQGTTYPKAGFLDEQNFLDFITAYQNSEIKFEYYRWNKIIKRELILNNLKYCNTEVAIFEDINLIFPVLCDLKNIYLLRRPSYNYFVRENSIIGASKSSFALKNITDREKVLRTIIDVADTKNIKNRTIVYNLNYFFLACLIDEVLRAKKNWKQNFGLIRSSYVFNNELFEEIQNHLSKYKKMVYSAFMKEHYFTLKFLRYASQLVHKTKRL